MDHITIQTEHNGACIIIVYQIVVNSRLKSDKNIQYLTSNIGGVFVGYVLRRC